MRKWLRRLSSLAVTAALLLSIVQPAYALTEDPTPLIILPGFSGPQLFMDYGEESEQQIWAPSFNGDTIRSVADVVLYALPKLIVDAGGNADDVVKKFGEIVPLLEKMELNPDGSSKYNITASPHGAYNSRWDVMTERGQENLNLQLALTKSMLSVVPANHIYIFANDWRRGQAEGAAALHAFIEEVKADSSHSKVNLMGVSYGGQLAAIYLALYGGESIERIVMQAPAIHGSQIAVDILEDEHFAFDPVVLLDLLAVYLERELSLNQRFGGVTMEQVSDIALQIIRAYIMPMLINFGCYWDVIPPDAYDRLKAQYLDPVDNAEIIRRSDIIHHQIMPNIGETLRSWQAKGVKIAIICGAGEPLIGGNMVSSDRIIDVTSMSGAYTLPLGEGGAAQAKQPICTDPTHTHRSPDGAIDAACCYLPDQTWFFFGQYHGQAAWDSYAHAIYSKWLYTDELQDVYSDPEYPQFRDSCNPSDGIEARFSGSVSGYLTAEDDVLLLKNLSTFELSLLAVSADGIVLDVPLVNRIVIRPGETARLNYEVTLPQQQQVFTLKVDFIRESLAPTTESRSFAFAALPASLPLPAAVRYDTQQGSPAQLEFQPLRSLFIAVSLAGSLIVASVAVGVMYRSKLKPEAEKKRRKKAKAK